MYFRTLPFIFLLAGNALAETADVHKIDFEDLEMSENNGYQYEFGHGNQQPYNDIIISGISVFRVGSGCGEDFGTYAINAPSGRNVARFHAWSASPPGFYENASIEFIRPADSVKMKIGHIGYHPWDTFSHTIRAYDGNGLQIGSDFESSHQINFVENYCAETGDYDDLSTMGVIQIGPSPDGRKISKITFFQREGGRCESDICQLYRRH